MDTIKVGIIGCGNISGIYLKNLTTVFPRVQVKSCADLDPARARAAEEKYPGVRAVSVEELLADPEIRIVVNLTIPKAHAEVAMRAVEAGKSVYNEKPLTITRDDAKALLAAARTRKVLVGGAPDTFMGAGLQTCRKAIDDGLIGRPVGATAFMLCHGHEGWHPDPEFYYKAGGGPMFDMGPYYLTALVSLMGPIQRVTGSAKITIPERLITSQPRNGTRITVDVPTHIAGVLDFVDGAVGTILTSFDVWGHQLPRIEIYGTEGSLCVPDPNGFGGPVRILKARTKEWVDLPLTHGYAENSRGVGVADMAYSLLRKRRPHRASGALAFHVLDVMHGIHEASEKGRHIRIRSQCDRPSAMVPGLPAGELDV